jgi:hypothetical protein
MLLTYQNSTKQKLCVFLLIISGAFLSNYAFAETKFNVNGITYNITSDTTCALDKGCDSITIIIPQEVTYLWKSYTVTSINGLAFANCTYLSRIEMPNSITAIGNLAFQSCHSLRDIKWPNSLSTIGNFAFANCQNLCSIELPNSVISIGEWAFDGCYNLKSIKLSNSLTTINKYAFYGCLSLKSIELPRALTSIGNYAFSKCDSISDVICRATLPIETARATFSQATYSSATLYVPDESIDAYRTTEYCWCRFQNIKSFSQYADIQSVPLSDVAEDPSVVYDLSGKRGNDIMHNLTPRVYVVRKGNKTRMVIVK